MAQKKIAIIAEKPSVAREIARIVGANDKRDGFLQGNDYLVTWAYGHLIGLAMPAEYGISGFKAEQLPILPHPFILKVRQVKVDKGYKPDSGALKQLKIIKKVWVSIPFLCLLSAGKQVFIPFLLIAFFNRSVKEKSISNFSLFLFLDEKKQKSRAAEKKAKNLSSRVK